MKLRDWVVRRLWTGDAGAAGAVAKLLLMPAEASFAAAVAVRGAAYRSGVLRTARAPVPVVSIGNIAVGGAGKTPFAAAVAGKLRGWGRRPAVVLSGYGPDEVLVHGELNPAIPVFAARRRIDAACEAAADGCDVVVLDDGFQHRALARDADIVLISADSWTGAIRLLPAGPFRESLPSLQRADLVVVTRKTADAGRSADVEHVLRGAGYRGSVVHAEIASIGLVSLDGARTAALSSLAGKDVCAVASLADPAPFFAQLTREGAAVQTRAYPDHYAFTASDAREIVEQSRGRTLVMTRKEAVKLRPLLPPCLDAWMVEQCVNYGMGEALVDATLRRALAAHAAA